MAYTWRCQPSKGRRSSECLSPCAEVFGVYGPIPIDHLKKQNPHLMTRGPAVSVWVHIYGRKVAPLCTRCYVPLETA
jgi:hypothetical protein